MGAWDDNNHPRCCSGRSLQGPNAEYQAANETKVKSTHPPRTLATYDSKCPPLGGRRSCYEDELSNPALGYEPLTSISIELPFSKAFHIASKQRHDSNGPNCLQLECSGAAAFLVLLPCTYPHQTYTHLPTSKSGLIAQQASVLVLFLPSYLKTEI